MKPRVSDTVLVVDGSLGLADLIATKFIRSLLYAFLSLALVLVAIVVGPLRSMGILLVFSTQRLQSRNTGSRFTAILLGKKVYARSILVFQNRTKGGFRGNGQKREIDIDDDVECEEADIISAYLVFPDAEITQCFTPLIERIMGLIGDQLGAIRAQGGVLRNIIIAGELIELPYVSDNQVW